MSAQWQRPDETEAEMWNRLFREEQEAKRRMDYADWLSEMHSRDREEHLLEQQHKMNREDDDERR